MKRNFRAFNLVFLLAAAIIYSSCSSGPENLSYSKQEIIKYYDSGKFKSELNGVIADAIDKFKNFNVNTNDAVVFDIDETALSNYEINKDFDFGYIPELWDKWLDSAKAPALPGVKRLYDFFVSKNFNIIFVTGRKNYQYDATYKNLLYAGYTKFDTLIVRKPEENNLTALEYKSKKREELTAKGYNITCDVGDQYSDLNGPDHGVQVKIPNYLYIIK